MNIDRLINKAKNSKSKNNILFLDFDGVINIPIKNINELTREEILNQTKYANKDCINNINKLCNLFNFKIVISSSYRHSGLDYCKKYLYNSSLDKSIEIIGTTSIYNVTGYRYEEILEYLSHIDFSGFLIIDDTDMYNLNDFLVKTKFDEGFNNEKLNEAIYKFKNLFSEVNPNIWTLK